MWKRLKFAWQAFRLKEGRVLFGAYTADLRTAPGCDCDENGCNDMALLCVSGVYYQIEKEFEDHYHACSKHAIERLRSLGCDDLVTIDEGEKIRKIK